MKQGFRKNRRDGMIFGVCAGMADQFGIDVLWTRVGFVALTLLGFGLPLLLAAPVASLMLGYPFGALRHLLPGLLAGALGLSALAIVAGSVTLGARGGAGLVALLVIPLAIPLLLFGSSPAEPGALGLAVATALLLAAVAPFAAGAALRASRG